MPVAESMPAASELILFLIFFVPGFISLKVHSYIIPSDKLDFSTALYEVVAYSTLNFIAVCSLFAVVVSGGLLLLQIPPILLLSFPPPLNSPLLLWHYVGTIDAALVSPLYWVQLLRDFYIHPFATYSLFVVIVLGLVFLVFPAIWPLIIDRAMISDVVIGITKKSIYPTPWDELFTGHLGRIRRAKCVKITLKEGKGEIVGLFAGDSSVSLYPFPQQIFIERVCKFDHTSMSWKPVNESRGTLIYGDQISKIQVYSIAKCQCAKLGCRKWIEAKNKKVS